MHFQSAILNGLWWAASVPAWLEYRRALEAPKRAQQRLLFQYLRENSATAFGRAHRFSKIRTVAEYQDRVPLRTFDDFAPFIERIGAGGDRVLTTAVVRRLLCTSGSTAAVKLVPYTTGLQREFARAIAPWICDLFSDIPMLAGGPAYWSVTPVGFDHRSTASHKTLPVGFDDDSAYVGGVWQRVVRATLAVPAAVALTGDIETFRYRTLRYLLAARELRLISIWHPSFLILLVEGLRRHWHNLLRDVREGTIGPSSDAAAMPGTRRVPHRPDRRRAAELERLGPENYRAIWPRLQLISCWGDGHAAVALARLREAFPAVRIQPKGLIATEAFVTLPFAGQHPLAIRSHFFEFIEDRGTVRLAHELETGGQYTLAVTTAGGLYRYRLGDRVEVDGRVGRTPSLRFIGKEDSVSDLAGEKLSEGFVAAVVASLIARHRLAPRFALLAPDLGAPPGAGTQPCAAAPDAGYTLFLETDREMPATLEADLERALSANPHYAYCVALGQLRPARVVRVATGAYAAYLNRCRERGQRIGDAKAAALSASFGWAEVFGRNQPCGDATHWPACATSSVARPLKSSVIPDLVS